MRYVLIIFTLLAFTSAKINIHVVPHSHDDAGWNWTFDEYFYRSRDDLNKGGVKNIISSVLYTLAEDPKRTFSQAEMVYFRKWWEEIATDKEQELVKKLISTGQFTFVNGGYVMPDEACPHYQDLIDQERLGLRWLKDTFNYTPTVGWSLDPFGHSATNAKLMADLGFESIVFCRIDAEDRQHRKENKQMEFFWEPFEGSNSIFTFICDNHYDPEDYFKFLYDERIIDLSEAELKEISDKLAETVRNNIKHRLHEEYFLFYGDDFTHENAHFTFRNLEMFMEYFNKHYPEFNMEYSTPERYFKAVKGQDFPTKKGGDFFPYADHDYAYWTGYFSSRQALKGLIADARETIQQLEEINLHLRLTSAAQHGKHYPQIEETLFRLREVSAINQHHDAVSGTAKERISKDYETMLTVAISKGKSLIEKIAGNMVKTDEKLMFCSFGVQFDKCKTAFEFIDRELYFLFNRNLSETAGIRVLHDDIKIFIGDQEIDSNIIDVDGEKRIFFKPETGVMVARRTGDNRILEKKDISTDSDILCNRDICIRTLESANKLKITVKEEDYNIQLDHAFYTGYDGNNSTIKPRDVNRNGAYILSTTEVNPEDFRLEESKVMSGSTVTVMEFRFSKSTLLLIYKHSEGEIVLESRINSWEGDRRDGNEFVLRVRTDIDNTEEIEGKSRPVFYTDSNGLNSMKRVVDWRATFPHEYKEPMASNFYPTLSNMHFSAGNKKAFLFTERSISAGQVNKGEFLFIINRHTTTDDSRGVDEALFEQTSWGYKFVATNKLFLGSVPQSALSETKKAIVFVSRKEIMAQKKIAAEVLEETFCLDATFYSLSQTKILIQVINKVNPVIHGHSRCRVRINLPNVRQVTITGYPKESKFLEDDDVFLENYQIATFESDIE